MRSSTEKMKKTAKPGLPLDKWIAAGGDPKAYKATKGLKK